MPHLGAPPIMKSGNRASPAKLGKDAAEVSFEIPAEIGIAATRVTNSTSSGAEAPPHPPKSLVPRACLLLHGIPTALLVADQRTRFGTFPTHIHARKRKRAVPDIISSPDAIIIQPESDAPGFLHSVSKKYLLFSKHTELMVQSNTSGLIGFVHAQFREVEAL